MAGTGQGRSDFPPMWKRCIEAIETESIVDSTSLVFLLPALSERR